MSNPTENAVAETTAQLRTQAQQAERELRWKDASKLWSRAIRSYPGPAGSSLTRHDVALMTKRAIACANTARSEARDAGNKSMREGGRRAWNEDDRDAAIERGNAAMVRFGFGHLVDG